VNRMSVPGLRSASIALIVGVCGAIAACGGSSNGGFGGYSPGPGSGSASGSGGGNGMNTVPVTVDVGPPAAGGSINTLYTTVTICAPGNSTECQTIDHVQVDTGSTGLRVLAAVLGNGLTAAQLPQARDASGNPVDECAQFADGYSWGTVRSADLLIGSETAAAVPIQVIGDTAAASIPASCVMGPQEDSVQSFGANAILGIGNFLSDCGIACEANPVAGAYYDCPPNAACMPVAMPVTAQLQNPVSLFAGDNNGVAIELPRVSTPAASVAGTMVFGIGTQADNAFPGAGNIYTVDPNYGTLTTLYNGGSYASSFIDSGSNAYFFIDDAIPTCADQPSFYCPSSATSLTAVIEDGRGTQGSIAFAVDNADADFASNAAALPNLAGPAGAGSMNAFDWGLPFFYGRQVYIAFESNTVAGVGGPWIGF